MSLLQFGEEENEQEEEGKPFLWKNGLKCFIYAILKEIKKYHATSVKKCAGITGNLPTISSRTINLSPSVLRRRMLPP